MEDDIQLMYSNIDIKENSPSEIAADLNYKGLRVLTFTQFIFLNTESLDRYESTRSLHHNPKELIKHRFMGYGTRNRLFDLLELKKVLGRKSKFLTILEK